MNFFKNKLKISLGYNLFRAFRGFTSVSTLKLVHADTILLCHDYNRGGYRDELPSSPLMDSIHEDLNKWKLGILQIALPGSVLLGNKAFNSPIGLDSIAIDLDSLKNKIRSLPGFFSTYLLKLFTNDDVLYYYLLCKVNPKFVIVINAPKSLCRVGRYLNIPILELNHGIGYVPKSHWWHRRKPDALPSHFLSLDRISSESITKDVGSSISLINIIEIPHPWYKNINQRKSENNLVLSDCKKKWKKLIVISLMWGYDGDHGGLDEMSGILSNGLMYSELIKAIADSHDEVYWCIRRHPLQSRLERYNYQIPFLDSLVETYTNCEWQKSTNATLDEILGLADGHITMASMTAYDASILGVKSMLLCPTVRENGIYSNLFNDLVEAGYAIKTPASTETIIEWARSAVKTTPYRITDATEDNWINLIDGLLKK